MTQDTPLKKYPHTTAEVAQMLGMPAAPTSLPMGSFPVADLPVAGLPVVEASQPIPNAALSTHTAASAPIEPKSLEQQAASQPVYVRVGKALLPFAAVFLIGIFLYYFFFTKVDFTTVFKGKPAASTPQLTVIQELEKQDIAGYNAWIASYYYHVSDPKLLNPEADNSGNGLSNFQKYLLNLNPKSYDTLGLGMADSQAIARGINPTTGRALTDGQKNIVNKYVDMEVVMNRLALYNLAHPTQVAGAMTEVNNNISGNNKYNYNDYYNNNPGSTQGIATQQGAGIVNNTQTQKTSPNTGANLSSINNSQADINTNVPGLLEIPDLKIKVPIIWSRDPKNFDKDLQVGVVHYPGTASPGQIGTTYISGHSSNYPWAKGSYNQIFSRLGNMALNTSFEITVTRTNGKTRVFNYVVTGTRQYTPTDQAQFANSGKSIVALSTCWPIGSTAKRLVVFGELTQVQN